MNNTLTNDESKVLLTEATDEDWRRAYNQRMERGMFYSKFLDSIEKYKFFTMQAYNQENAVYHFYRTFGCDPHFMDPNHDYLYGVSLSSNTPDIQLANGVTVEVKSYPAAYSKILKLKYGLWIPHGATEDDLRDLIWMKDFHGADRVIFVSPDCSKGCELKKDKIQFYHEGDHTVDYAATHKVPVYFYAEIDGWFDLSSDRS